MRPAAIFSDHMILQRGKPLPVWGAGADGETVTARLRGIERSAVVKNGKWRVSFPPQETGEPCALTVTCGTESVVYGDVLFGDVWLAGGQSNMEWALADAKGGAEEIAAAGDPDLRFYNVPKCCLSSRLEEAEKDARWTPCVGGDARYISAVAYWFAKEVRRVTGVPVGIVGCNWGGTSAAAWVSREDLERLVSGKRYADDYRERAGDKPFTQKEGEWPPPPSMYSPFRPNGLYETMLSRAAPYALKGFLYYQGEEDWSRHADYFDWMCLLIDRWRRDFQDADLPFLLVQLPAYDTSENIAKGWAGEEWPRLRQAQERVSRFVRHTGMAVTLDCGELDDIHPTDKEPVGFRLALQALKKVYGLDVEADGPRPLLCEQDGAALCLTFDAGLDLRGGSSFEMAGEDGCFSPAQAAVFEKTLRLSAPAVTGPPRAVRYAWRAYCEASLFGENGLPAAPFWWTV